MRKQAPFLAISACLYGTLPDWMQPPVPPVRFAMLQKPCYSKFLLGMETLDEQLLRRTVSCKLPLAEELRTVDNVRLQNRNLILWSLRISFFNFSSPGYVDPTNSLKYFKFMLRKLSGPQTLRTWDMCQITSLAGHQIQCIRRSWAHMSSAINYTVRRWDLKYVLTMFLTLFSSSHDRLLDTDDYQKRPDNTPEEKTFYTF